eukprot:SAG22_NODE_5113_length_1083_cov_1.021341_2_plen_196_part_01
MWTSSDPVACCRLLLNWPGLQREIERTSADLDLMRVMAVQEAVPADDDGEDGAELAAELDEAAQAHAGVQRLEDELQLLFRRLDGLRTPTEKIRRQVSKALPSLADPLELCLSQYLSLRSVWPPAGRGRTVRRRGPAAQAGLLLLPLLLRGVGQGQGERPMSQLRATTGLDIIRVDPQEKAVPYSPAAGFSPSGFG